MLLPDAELSASMVVIATMDADKSVVASAGYERGFSRSS
jgi:hypothetical protein